MLCVLRCCLVELRHDTLIPTGSLVRVDMTHGPGTAASADLSPLWLYLKSQWRAHYRLLEELLIVKDVLALPQFYL
jgi:hypothetical protein